MNVKAREVTADNVTVGEQGENGVPEITVSVEAPVGTLTPAETTDYQLAYYDNPEDRNAVTVEQMLAAPGEYVAVLTLLRQLCRLRGEDHHRGLGWKAPSPVT